MLIGILGLSGVKKKFLPEKSKLFFNAYNYDLGSSDRQKDFVGHMKLRSTRFSDFKDLNQLAAELISSRTRDTERNNVNWLRIEDLKFEKGKRKPPSQDRP